MMEHDIPRKHNKSRQNLRDGRNDRRRPRVRRFLRFLRRNRRPLLLWGLLLLLAAALIAVLIFAIRRIHALDVRTQALLEQETIELTAEKVAQNVNPAHAYQAGNFVADGDFMTYADDNYVSLQGIDVSDHNGEVDWAKVKQAGIQFAFIRLGYRGYTEGGIHPDSQFEANVKGALAQDIPVGIYFFSQAVNEEEARQEAQYCIQQMNALSPALTPALPVVYDPEDAPSDNARTTNLSGEQLTKNALAFIDEIRNAGYVPAIYTNAQWQENVLDMSQFQDVIVWFAGFTQVPHSQYHFEYWQYSYQGHVDGIAEDIPVDMDIRLVPVK